ncbi:MAG TPA: hypothetical protein VFF52_22780 [Isosphaeraceae bacterium]|nr:hypothetical protein [Isosphaeraceae bacterium]
MSTVRTKPPKFRLGDWVTFRYGARQVFAQVIEDRGPLGANRRRLYRIRLDQDLNEPIAFEMPEDEMEKAVPDKAAILRYLKQGGLVKILHTNLQGGRNQPRVWLTLSPRGEVSYTCEASRRLIGTGATVPFWGLLENKIFLPKKDVIIDYLKTSFGLTREEAEEVVEAVGTAP